MHADRAAVVRACRHGTTALVLLSLACAAWADPPATSAAEPAAPPSDARPSAARPHDTRPNIVLCMADDQGWGDMAYNGHPALKTPVFDEMARSGLRLDRFYAAAPVCSPTRGSVLTGRTPNRYGTFSWGHSLRPQERTLAEQLRAAGYATGHFGKWHLGSVLADSDLSPGACGFERWLSAPNFFDLDPWLSREGRAERFEGESSEIVVEAALAFARDEQRAGRPFLAVVWFGSPHAPHRGTADDLALYKDQGKQQHFLAEITAMDRAMGRLRAGLREIGAADNTLLWYTSDNGAIPAGSTGGLRGRKGRIYEGGLRVPCLVEWPARLSTPRRCDVAAGTIDIYPTVLEVAGVAIEATQPPLDGESLVALFEGTASQRGRPLGFWDTPIAGFRTPSDEILAYVAERQQAGAPIPPDHPAQGLPPAGFDRWNEPEGSYPGHAAWLDGRWKLHRIEDRSGAGDVRWELYDLALDEQESTDRSAAEPERVARMQRELEAWLASVVASLRGADYVNE